MDYFVLNDVPRTYETSQQGVDFENIELEIQSKNTDLIDRARGSTESKVAVSFNRARGSTEE